jgi:Protein of unknown function (DUF2948)
MKAAPKTRGLRLRAEDAEDLGVLSACLQDALVPVGAISFDGRRHRFAMALNRFCWECEGPGNAGRGHQRVATGLRVEGVRSVRAQGIDRGKADQVLELLSILGEAGPEGSATLTFVFAGGGAMRLEVECIDCYLADLDQPVPVPVRPRHLVDPDR